MVASRGPVPKRSQVRRRTNVNADGLGISTAPGAQDIEVPEPDEAWHDIAYDWYVSLLESGQAIYYQPSDWMTAYVLAQTLSDHLGPQYIGMRQNGAGTQVAEYGRLPLAGGTLASLLKGMGLLGVTEGDRRRMRIELSTTPPEEPVESANVRAINTARSALGVS